MTAAPAALGLISFNLVFGAGLGAGLTVPLLLYSLVFLGTVI